MPFPTPNPGASESLPFRKLTLDVDGMETSIDPPALFERGLMTNGEARLLITTPRDRPEVLRVLAHCLAEPLFLLYVLHTERGEGDLGRYQSPSLDSAQVDEFLADFEAFFAGDARHDLWVHSAGDGRTLVWDRHDLIFAEGGPLADIEQTLEAMGFEAGVAPRVSAGPHIHHYRSEFDADAAAVLARFDWIRSDLRPEDQQV